MHILWITVWITYAKNVEYQSISHFYVEERGIFFRAMWKKSFLIVDNESDGLKLKKDKRFIGFFMVKLEIGI